MQTYERDMLPAFQQEPAPVERPTFHATPRRRARRRYPPAGTNHTFVDPASLPLRGGRIEEAPPVLSLSQQERERLVLNALQARYPLMTTAREVASKIKMPYGHVQTILEGLARPGAIDSPRKGYYRWKPAPEGGNHVQA